MYYIYVIKSEKDNNIYIGFTANPEKRLREHNAGKVKSTKHRKPFILIYQEEYKNKTTAIKREKFLKSGCGREFIKYTLKGAPVAQLDRASVS